MTRSVNEVENQVIKACRGAGLSVGQAQMIADVMVRDVAALPVMLDALEHCDATSQCVSTSPYVVENANILVDGPCACDALAAGAPAVELRGISNTVLTQAFFAGADIADTDHGILITGSPHRTARPTRIVLADDLWNRLDHFAHKVYVPETEASRLAGAGAGLTDND